MAKKKTAAHAAPDADAVIDAAFDLALTKGWGRVRMRDVADAAGTDLYRVVSLFPDKTAIFEGFLDRIDREVLTGEVDPADGPRERLFDVVMRRFDALGPRKEAIRAISRDACGDPLGCVGVLPRFGRSMAWMLEAAGISASGLCGLARINGLGLVYAKAFRTWLDDDTPDQSRTMAALDKALHRAEFFAGLCDGGLKGALRRRREGPAEAA